MNTLTQERAGACTWWGLAVLTVPSFVVAMDMTALFLALPRISADLGASATQQLWISDSYGFTVAGFVITMATVGDRIGRRRLLLVGAAAFALVSAVAAFAPDPVTLIAARALLGVAGATLMPSTLALISTMFRDDAQRGTAFAIWATCQFTGGALGPVLAGFLLQHFSWGSVFLVAVPAMAVLLVAGPSLLPEHRNPAPARLDPTSVALSLAAVAAVIYGLKQLAVDGFGAVPLVAVLAGAGIGVVFVRRQLRLDAPLLDLRLLRNPRFTGLLVALVVAGVVMAGSGLMGTQYLQSVLGYSPVVAALMFAPMGLGVATGTMLAPALARRVPAERAITGGLAVSVLGCVLLAVADDAVLVMVGVTVLALGTGPLFALGTGMIVGSVPVERAGSAASMSEMSNYLGGSTGIALLGGLGAAVYRLRFGGPGQTLAETTAATHAQPVLDAARAAFTSGVHVVGVVSALLVAALVLTVARTQRVAR